MNSESPGKILDEFDTELARYESFADKLKALVIEIIKEHGRDVHSVSARVKSRASFTRKISDTNRNYTKLSDITDVCGIRIITYFQDDVDVIAELIIRDRLRGRFCG